jgi:hypothetical protein
MTTTFEFYTDIDGALHFVIRQPYKRMAMNEEDAIRFAQFIFKITDAPNQRLQPTAFSGSNSDAA